MPDISDQPGTPELESLSQRLRALRSARQWTLEELANRTGLSKPFLSRLESGSRQPSLGAVLTLARVFGVQMGSLFDSPSNEDGCLVIRADTPTVQSANGISYVPLSSASRFNLQPIRVTISPWRRGDEQHQHQGEEWLYVLSGKLRLTVGDRQLEINTSEAAHLDSRQPHRLDALDGKEAELLLVACPMPTAIHARRESAEMTAEIVG